MTRTRRQVLVAATATTVGLAGCLGGDGGRDDTETVETDAPETTAAATTEAPTETGGDGSSGAALEVAAHPTHGDVLVDGEGMTLYMFDNDERGAGASTCSGDCLDAWPPLTAEGDPAVGEAVAAGVTTFEREDGTTQVAANGWPLYYFASDEAPGDATGQGASDVWWVLDPSGEPIRATEEETESETGTDA